MENNTVQREVYFHDFLKNVMSSGLFLAICILTTASAVVGLVSGDGLPVFEILFSIFFWMSYSAAKKEGPLDAKPIKYVGGVIKAEYILNWVFVGLFAVCAGLLFLSGAGFSAFIDPSFTDSDFYSEIFSEIPPELQSEFEASGALEILSSLGISFLFFLFAIVFLLFAGAFLAINLLYYKNLKLFAESVHTSTLFNSFYLKKVKKIGGWFIFFAVSSGLSALGGETASVMITSGIETVVYILAFLLIKNNFYQFYTGDVEAPKPVYYQPQQNTYQPQQNTYQPQQPVSNPVESAPECTETEAFEVVAETNETVSETEAEENQ